MSGTCLILHDIRSTHNVGSLLRTAECFGVKQIYFTGYTPFPKLDDDNRLPHIYKKLTKQIHKTALGAETMLSMHNRTDINDLIAELKDADYKVVGLEQSPKSISLPNFKPSPKLALLIGREVEGIDPKLLAKMDSIVEIPMKGQKESLNVVQATAVALYHINML